jgi:hypothetical protein
MSRRDSNPIPTWLYRLLVPGRIHSQDRLPILMNAQNQPAFYFIQDRFGISRPCSCS